MNFLGGSGISAGQCFVFFQFIFRSSVQFAWHFNLNRYILITVNGRVFHRDDSFSFQTDLRTGLCAFTDLTEDVTVECFNKCFSPKYSSSKWNCNSRVYIHAFSFISRFISYIYFQHQISGFSAVDTRHTLTAESDLFTGINSCRNMNFQRLRCRSWSIWVA